MTVTDILKRIFDDRKWFSDRLYAGSFDLKLPNVLFCVEICTRIILLQIITAAIHVLVDAFNLFNARFDCIW